jgi:nicotinate-nucleotide pyrophosphorylase (carboxylating)
MNLSFLTDEAIHQFIEQALREDIGEGDHSTLGAVPKDLISQARLLVKDDGVLAGVAMAEKIFQHFDSRLTLEIFLQDGQTVTKGDVAFVVSGPARSILSTERLVLNCMQRMSGIATYTHRLTRLIEGTGAQVMDTRKTTPNFRLLEKWAVAIGGGRNHRFALYDMVMLKDNHHDLAGGISTAVASVKSYLTKTGKTLKIEVEARNLAEVEEALKSNVDVIMLDNMSIEEMKTAVQKINGRCKTEASGGITESTLRAVAQCGVDYISVGALTHSVKSLDLSLKVLR